VGWFSRGVRRSKEPEVPPEPAGARELALAIAYHHTTKHGLHRYATGPYELDWETQPDPFRRFEGAPLLPLDREPFGAGPPYASAFAPGTVAPRAFNRASVSQLFFDSLSLSATKSYGTSRWSLRVNPSSGNLHPTEAYLITGPIDGLAPEPFIAHYAPREHALEIRAVLPDVAWQSLARELAPNAMLVGLSSIHWREAWKYGERAFRYCQHDVGHAIAATAIAAAGLGWRARLCDEIGWDELELLLGLTKSTGPEREEPEALLMIEPQGAPTGGVRFDAALKEQLAALRWRGEPNELSSGHVEWPVIPAVAEATRKPAGAMTFAEIAVAPSVTSGARTPIALHTIVRQRRSAVALDGKTSMSRDDFLSVLARTLPSVSPLVFGALPWTPQVHLFVFVHRVRDVDPGLYLVVRDATAVSELRAALDPTFEWSRVDGSPPELELFRLRRGDVRGMAREVSCRQDIAADGCFSLGMLARFLPALESHGAWFYRRLFWECGAVGQVLYLEAEALGLRGTGIGCFFDDPVHRAAGLRTLAWQSLYHFAFGAHVDDPRLSTESAYDEGTARATHTSDAAP
jgi:SagB-type dehydrogenase family enzyme